MTVSKRRIAPQPAETPEITAQPRPVTDEMLSSLSFDDGLSVDPEDLGSHFLSEATEQGDFQSVLSGQVLELSLASAPPSDSALTGPNFEPDASVWEQTVDIALQNVGLELLPLTTTESESDATQDNERDSRVSESHIRELSLFDRESAEEGETTEPNAVTEDGGRHARQTPHVPLGAQVETPLPERERSPALDAATVPTLVRRTRSALKRVASKLRGAAHKLESTASRAKRSR
jgi:hypothetical protein